MKSDFVFNEKIIFPKDPTFSKKQLEVYKKIYAVKYEICKEQNPRFIAEIGVRAGYSAWAFLQACPDAFYLGFDANNGTHGGQGGKDGRYFKWAEKILDGFGFTFNLVQLDTQTVNKLGINDVELFHVDGDHTINGVMHDLDLAFKAISNDGLILVDDIDYLATVKQGVFLWIDKMLEVIKVEKRESPRGEMLIRKK